MLQLYSTFWTAIVLVIALSSCTSFKDNNHLPSFARWESERVLRIDVVEASAGAGMLDQQNRVVIRQGDQNVIFSPAVVSIGSGVSRTSIEEPPVRISQVLTVGDGVADFFASVWSDAGMTELRYDLFLDTDWEEVVNGDLYIHLSQTVDRKDVYRRIPIDFSESSHGVYHRAIAFEAIASTVGPSVYVTNMPGDSQTFKLTYARLDLKSEQVVVEFGFPKKCFPWEC